MVGQRRNLCHGNSPELDEVVGLEVPRLADPDHDQTLHVEPGRRDNVEARSLLAFEAFGLRRSGDEIACGSEHLAGFRSELEPAVTEHNKNTPEGR